MKPFLGGLAGLLDENTPGLAKGQGFKVIQSDPGFEPVASRRQGARPGPAGQGCLLGADPELGAALWIFHLRQLGVLWSGIGSPAGQKGFRTQWDGHGFRDFCLEI